MGSLGADDFGKSVTFMSGLADAYKTISIVN